MKTKLSKAQMKKVKSIAKKHSLSMHEAARFFVQMGI